MTPTRSTRSRHRRATGFTLIELMIVVVIVAVLATLAYGAYQTQVRKARRSDAIAMLSAIQQAQERWRANCTSYTASITNPAQDAATMCNASKGLGLANTTAGGYYTLSPSSVSDSGYTLTATAVAGTSQASDTAGGSSCATLTVIVSNGSATPQPSACWSK
jgi:type IV pilus assembly protein PilE